MTDMTATPVTTILRAEGFSCPSCVKKIETRLSTLPGVSDVTVHYASARIEVDHDGTVEDQLLVDEVGKAGFSSAVSPF